MFDEDLEDKESCGNCDGTGIADCPMEWGDFCPEECPACGGSQKVVCPACDGTGYEDI